METRLLEYFVTVADELSVTRASERLFVAQSTVSAGLRSLEGELGVRLFERTTKTVRLLPAGEAMLPLAREMLDDLDALRRVGSESRQGLRGRVRIGTFAALQLLDLPGILGRFRRENPLVDIQLVGSTAGSTGLTDDLAHGRLDLAFTALPAASGLDTWPLARFEFVALVPLGHPLAARAAVAAAGAGPRAGGVGVDAGGVAARAAVAPGAVAPGSGAGSVSLAELAGEDWVDVLPGYGNRVQLEGALAERGIVRHISAELAELPSVAPCVAAGLGVAVVPNVVEAPGCAVLTLTDELAPWVVSLSARRGSGRRPQVKALIDTVLAAVA